MRHPRAPRMRGQGELPLAPCWFALLFAAAGGFVGVPVLPAGGGGAEEAGAATVPGFEGGGAAEGAVGPTGPNCVPPGGATPTCVTVFAGGGGVFPPPVRGGFHPGGGAFDI